MHIERTIPNIPQPLPVYRLYSSAVQSKAVVGRLPKTHIIRTGSHSR